MKRYGLLLVLFAGALLTMGANDSVNARFSDIGHKLVCQCGCTQILLECNHVGCPVSPVMIDELHQQLAKGGGDTSIFNWFAAKYGPVALAAPIRGGFDTVAWIVPGTVSLLALLVVVWIVRRWQKKQPVTPEGVSVAETGAADDLRERIRRETEY